MSYETTTPSKFTDCNKFNLEKVDFTLKEKNFSF